MQVDENQFEFLKVVPSRIEQRAAPGFGELVNLG